MSNRLNEKIRAIRLIEGSSNTEEVEITPREIIHTPNRYRTEDILNALCVFADESILEAEIKDKNLANTIKQLKSAK